MVNLYSVGTRLEDVTHLEKVTSTSVEKLLKGITEISFQGYFNSAEILGKYFRTESNKEDASIILNSSGGTEDLISIIIESCKSPVLILADHKRNSFASSLEAYASLKERFPVKISYCENDLERINSSRIFCDVIRTIDKINKARFGLIGEPSDWLLTSKNFNGFGNFKTNLIKIDVNHLVAEVDKINVESTLEIIENWKSGFNKILVDNDSLINSAKVYYALKSIIAESKLDVLSVRCFDLLSYNYTACMGISLCNDDGVTSGCEGDIPTTFTMMLAQQLSSQPVWMANPSAIIKDKNEIVFAHCTVPSSFIADRSNAELTTHMESGKSTAIRGPLKSSRVTILRMGSQFNKITAVTGHIVESDMKDEHLCRTQAKIRIDGDVKRWMNNTLGNHHVIVYGNLLQELEYFCDFTGVELIRI